MMTSFRALLVIASLAASPALANCNPPPPGLDFNSWLALCPAEINYAYQVYGTGIDPNVFVQSLYAMYVQAGMGGGASGGLPYPTGPCDSAGATYCPSSGYLLTCNGQQWLTGAAQC